MKTYSTTRLFQESKVFDIGQLYGQKVLLHNPYKNKYNEKRYMFIILEIKTHLEKLNVLKLLILVLQNKNVNYIEK